MIKNFQIKSNKRWAISQVSIRPLGLVIYRTSFINGGNKSGSGGLDYLKSGNKHIRTETISILGCIFTRSQ